MGIRMNDILAPIPFLCSGHFNLLQRSIVKYKDARFIMILIIMG
jgi:hypothetical protein